MLMVRMTDADHAWLTALAARESRTLAGMARVLIAEAKAARMPARPGVRDRIKAVAGMRVAKGKGRTKQ
jgi:hypothetical protein